MPADDRGIVPARVGALSRWCDQDTLPRTELDPLSVLLFSQQGLYDSPLMMLESVGKLLDFAWTREEPTNQRVFQKGGERAAAHCRAH
jgi:hypothetical protein